MLWRFEHTIESSKKVGIVVVDHFAHFEAGVAQRANKLIAIGESGTNLGQLEDATRLEHTASLTDKSGPIGAHERETEHDDIDAGVWQRHFGQVSCLNVAICISNQVKRANLHRIVAASVDERASQARLAAAKVGNGHRRVAMVTTTTNKQSQFVSNAIQGIERPLEHLVAIGGVIGVERFGFPPIACECRVSGLFVQLFVQKAKLPTGQLSTQFVKVRNFSA